MKDKYSFPNTILIPISTFNTISNILNISSIYDISFLLKIIVSYEFNFPINPNISEMLNEVFYDKFCKVNRNENILQEDVEDIIHSISVELYKSIYRFIQDFDNEIYSSIYKVSYNGKNIIFCKK